MYFPTLPSAATILQETTEQTASPPDPNAAGGEGETGTTPVGPCGGGGGMMIPMLAILAIFWIVMIGPERKKRKAREAMLGQLKKGDKVMTSGGMFGSVAQVQDDIITVQVADNVRIKFTRGAIQGVVDADGTPPASSGPKG